MGADLGHRRRRRDRRARRSRRRSARRSIVTSSSDEKLAARARARRRRRRSTTRPDDVVARVKEVTGGGAHVVVDDVGEATWRRTLDAARPKGRIVVCGATTGPNPPAALHRVWWKQLVDPRLDDGHARRLPGRLRPDRRRQGAPGRRQRVPARRGARRARAARGRRAARQDRRFRDLLVGRRGGSAGAGRSARGSGRVMLLPLEPAGAATRAPRTGSGTKTARCSAKSRADGITLRFP